jgi:hypothetical protein
MEPLMTVQKQFGRRRSLHATAPVPRPVETRIGRGEVRVPEPVCDADGKDWEPRQRPPSRKARKMSSAEPWRSISIVATLGFGLSSWLLPDAIQDIVQLVLGILTAGALFAGLRARIRRAQSSE